MMKAGTKFLAAGTRVRVKDPVTVPAWSEWENDNQRTSTSVKKRLQQMFFKGDKRIQAEVVFIGSESERDKLRSKGWVKVQIRDAAGAMIVITADALNLAAS